MKKLTCLIIFACALYLSSCTKKPLCCVMPVPPTISMQKNGAALVLPILKSLRINDSIFVATPGPGILSTAKDSLTFHLVYKSLGSFKPTAADVSYTGFGASGKVDYVLDDTFDNSIDISEFDAQQNPATTNPDPTELKATFNLRFTNAAHTTTVSLLNGKFTAYLGN